MVFKVSEGTMYAEITQICHQCGVPVLKRQNVALIPSRNKEYTDSHSAFGQNITLEIPLTEIPRQSTIFALQFNN